MHLVRGTSGENILRLPEVELILMDLKEMDEIKWLGGRPGITKFRLPEDLEYSSLRLEGRA